MELQKSIKDYIKSNYGGEIILLNNTWVTNNNWNYIKYKSCTNLLITASIWFNINYMLGINDNNENLIQLNVWQQCCSQTPVHFNQFYEPRKTSTKLKMTHICAHFYNFTLKLQISKKSQNY